MSNEPVGVWIEGFPPEFNDLPASGIIDERTVSFMPFWVTDGKRVALAHAAGRKSWSSGMAWVAHNKVTHYMRLTIPEIPEDTKRQGDS